VWSNRVFPWREDVGKEITDPLLAANPWLTLEDVPAGGAQSLSPDRTKFLAAAAGGTAPDIYSGGTRLAQDDFLVGATGSLERFLAASKVLKKGDIWESLRRPAEFKGHATTIPYSPDTRILYTHVENAQKAGLDPEKPPTRWSELEAGAQKAFRGGAGAVQHLGFYPFMGSGGNDLWLLYYWQLGGQELSADGSKITLFNERTIEALTWLKKLVDNQGGWQAIDAFRGTFTAQNGFTEFMGGAATYYHATLSERSEQFARSAPTMRYAINTMPLPDRGGSSANYGGCHAFPITRGSKNPEAAWLFIEHVTNPENNIKFAVRYDRVPIRQASTASPAYIQGDKGRSLQAQEMTRRRFPVEVAGGSEILPLLQLVPAVFAGQVSIQDALQERERLAQEVLDRWSERVKSVTP
jgi:multiple sugar transport system substrate-binding protein